MVRRLILRKKLKLLLTINFKSLFSEKKTLKSFIDYLMLILSTSNYFMDQCESYGISTIQTLSQY